MPEFNIIDVSDWPVVNEEMSGASAKVWLSDPSGPTGPSGLWLFKPVSVHQNGSTQGGDWAEKLSAEVAKMLSIPTAEIEMAMREGRNGTLSRNVRVGPELDRWEGGLWLDADPSRTYSLAGASPSQRSRGASSGHSLDELHRSLTQLGAPPQAEGAVRDLNGFDVFSCYVVLDALISNRDRHEANWSVLRPALIGGDPLLAAAYDQEGSFGYNLTDENRVRILQDEDGVRRWSGRGTAWRFEWLQSEQVPSLVEAATRFVSRASPDLRAFVERQLADFSTQAASDLAGAIPRMSEAARTFSTNLLSNNLERLHDGLRDAGTR